MHRGNLKIDAKLYFPWSAEKLLDLLQPSIFAGYQGLYQHLQHVNAQPSVCSKLLVNLLSFIYFPIPGFFSAIR